MTLNDFSFHDAIILKVTELTALSRLEILLNFPIDWNNNIFEHRLLVFENVSSYSVSELLLDGYPTILEVSTPVMKSPLTIRDHATYQVDLKTNAGKRSIEYTSCELIHPKNEP